MIQRHFQHIIRSKAIGSFCDHPGFVVETLHTAEIDLTFDLEPVEQERPVSPQHLGHLLHRLEPGAHGSRAPLIEKQAGPTRAAVEPETLKILFEQVGPNAFEVAGQQVFKFDHLAIDQIFLTFQQAPVVFGQNRRFAIGLKFLDLLGSDLIDRLAHVAHHMEAVEDIDRIDGPLGDHRQVRLLHVAANKLQFFGPLRTKPVEEAPKNLGGAVGSDPEKPLPAGIKLVNQGDELVLGTLAPADLIGADLRDSFQVSVFKPPINGHFDRTDHAVPTGHKRTGHLLPTHPFGPLGQKPGVGGSQPVLAPRPRQLLHFDPAARAVDPPGSVEEKDQDSPQGHKLKTPLAQGIVAGSFAAATRADWPTSDRGAQSDIQGQSLAFTPLALFIDKTMPIRLPQVEASGYAVGALKIHP